MNQGNMTAKETVVTDYDKMSAHDLVSEIFNTALWWDGEQYPNILSRLEFLLRKAVIREASVGEIEVKVRESGDELSRPGDPDRIVTVSEQFICQTWVPEGKYALVKIESKGGDA